MDGVTEEMLVGGPCFRSASLPWDSCMKGSLLATLSVGYDVSKDIMRMVRLSP